MSHDNQWNEKVQRGRALVTEINDRKWELGDLANEVAPAGANGVHNDDVLGAFADEIGVSRQTLHTYRYVSTQWPAVARATAQTWTTHKMLAAREDRFDIIAEQTWTYNSLSDRLGRLPNPSRVNKDTGEIDGPAPTPTQIQAALADPAVAEQVFKDRRTGAAASRAMQANDDEAAARVDADPSVRKAKNAERVSEFQHELTKATKALHDSVRALASTTLNSDDVDAATHELRLIRAAADLVDHSLTSSDLDLDAELAAILSGGQ